MNQRQFGLAATLLVVTACAVLLGFLRDFWANARALIFLMAAGIVVLQFVVVLAGIGFEWQQMSRRAKLIISGLILLLTSLAPSIWAINS